MFSYYTGIQTSLQGALLWCPLGQGGREHVLIRKAKPSIRSRSFQHPCHLQTRAEGSALCGPGRECARCRNPYFNTLLLGLLHSAQGVGTAKIDSVFLKK